MPKEKHYASFEALKEAVAASEEVASEPVTEAVPQKKSVVGAVAKLEKKMDFDRYAKRKGVKASHLAGMRAFCKNPGAPRTMEQWDKVFESY